jgi:GTP-binding protein
MLSRIRIIVQKGMNRHQMLSTSAVKADSLPEHLRHAIHGNNRKKERMDSITPGILRDRVRHMKRLEAVEPTIELIASLRKQGLGSTRKKNHIFSKVSDKQISQFTAENNTSKRTLTGAGGFAKHLTSASSDWPIFDHILPEIAFAGHSNSGKSTLVNAMAGVKASSGPASVSDRAGWTDRICFYQLGKKPPVLNLADFPGYGHAVASSQEIKQWKIMTRNYIQTRAVLTLCCIMVDCTRGLCGLDKSLVRFLHAERVPWQVVLTKGDLLTAHELAQALEIVQQDLSYVVGSRGKPVSVDSLPPIIPVSANTGAGVKQLWDSLRKTAYRSTLEEGKCDNLPDHAVREHSKAFLVRRMRQLATMRAQRRK